MASPNQKFKQSLKKVSSRSQGSPGQRNKPKSRKPTSSPAQKDRDRKKNQTFRQNLLKELDAGIKKGTAGVSSSGGGSGHLVVVQAYQRVHMILDFQYIT